MCVYPRETQSHSACAKVVMHWFWFDLNWLTTSRRNNISVNLANTITARLDITASLCLVNEMMVASLHLPYLIYQLVISDRRILTQPDQTLHIHSGLANQKRTLNPTVGDGTIKTTIWICQYGCPCIKMLLSPSISAMHAILAPTLLCTF